MSLSKMLKSCLIWLTVLACCLAWSAQASAQHIEPTEKAKEQSAGKPEITLQIVFVLDQDKPTVAFIVTNNSALDLSIESPGVNGCPIIITKPDGEEIFDVAIFERIGPVPIVKAGQSRIEKGDIGLSLDINLLFEPGTYHVRWRATPSESKVTYDSNELLVLREKGATVIDPRTGMPRTIGEADDNDKEKNEE